MAEDSSAGWLISQPALFDVQAPGMTCLSSLRNGEPGTIPASNFPPWSPSYDLHLVDEDTAEEREVVWSRRDALDPVMALNNSKGCGGVMRVAPGVSWRVIRS